MKRTYGFEALCEILRDHEIQSTGVVCGHITRIDFIEGEDLALVAHFNEDEPATAQQELDFHARNKNPQSERGE